MNRLNDDFMIEKYIHHSIHEDVDSSDKINFDLIHYEYSDVKAAEEWGFRNNRIIITPKNTLHDLEDSWVQFNSMIKKHRRESDWMSISIFGITNMRHYDYLKSHLLSIPASDAILEAAEELENRVDFDSINYTKGDVADAISWGNEFNRAIVYPTQTLDDLEKIWDNYNLMIKKHRRESDWKSEELFGISNLRHYEYLKSIFLKQSGSCNDEWTADDPIVMEMNIEPEFFYTKYMETVFDDPGTTAAEFREAAITAAFKSKSYYESSYTSKAIEKALKRYNEEFTNVDSTFIPAGDLPYFTPEEMIDFGVFAPVDADNYFGCAADNETIAPGVSVKEWFDNYKYNFDGFDTSVRTEYASMWTNMMHKLYSTYGRIKESGDINKLNAHKQSILEMGWNPEIPFTPENRVKANRRIKSIIESYSEKTDFIDLREMDSSADITTIVEDAKQDDLYPVYIVLVEGTSVFSKGIKLVTNGTYSHAAIAFDPSLNEIFSFGVLGNKKMSGGFVVEDIANYPKENHLGVFTIFVKKPDYDAIVDKVDWFKKNAESTSYSYKNILTYLFHIPYNNDKKMICSQFVDRILKIAHIDLTNKDSSMVNPNTFKKITSTNKKIYILFENLVKLYDSSRIKRLITSLQHKAMPIKERALSDLPSEFLLIEGSYDLAKLNYISTSVQVYRDAVISHIYENMVSPMTALTAYTEAKEFPIQFDDDGNLLIKNLRRIDYAAEYATSHRLLVEYEKSHNTEGMKYELSKLWMMNILIERAVHKHSSNTKELNALYVSRAHIINDFKKYLAIVQDKDKSFNFAEYYDNSPFSSAVLKINGPTMKYTVEMIKRLLKA